MADLYDELTMSPEQRKAHQANDRAVMDAYGFVKGSPARTSESACVAEKVTRNERSDLCNIRTSPILTFTITFDQAKAYRKANKMPTQFREAAWTDLKVEVYI